MKFGFRFKHPVFPLNPLDPSDLPPEGWNTCVDNWWERLKALFGVGSSPFSACCEWEKRENERYEDSKSPYYVLRFRSKLKGFANSMGQYGYEGAHVRFFSDKARAEIWTETIMGSWVLAVIKVTGEMGCACDATVISPESLPNPVKESLIRALSGLKVRFELCSLRNMKA